MKDIDVMKNQEQDSFVFEGFESSNTTPVPDVLFDELLSELSGAELKVLLYIIRRTKGFKKDTDAISFSQFLEGIITKEKKVLDRGCGVKDRTTLSKCLASLEKKGCITSTKGKEAQGDNATTLYSIHFKEVVGKPYHPAGEGSRETLPPVVGEPDHGSRVSLLPVVGFPYQQETVLQETVLQETVLQGGNATPQPKLDAKHMERRVEEIRRVLDAFRGFPATWAKDDEVGAITIAKAGRTDQEITWALESIRDDSDQFDANHFSMKAVAKRIDTIKQQRQPQQVREETGKQGEKDDGRSTDWDKYVGNGPEVREARRREIEELKAKGELLPT